MSRSAPSVLGEADAVAGALAADAALDEEDWEQRDARESEREWIEAQRIEWEGYARVFDRAAAPESRRPGRRTAVVLLDPNRFSTTARR